LGFLLDDYYSTRLEKALALEKGEGCVKLKVILNACVDEGALPREVFIE